jgi:3-isopropylmalate/(R)-2-methylmalate dehydratase small subunit
MRIKGRAWKLGDGISTDHITPGRFFHLRSDPPELAKHCLEDTLPAFAREVRPGDFLVAGRNFGQGSSREHAPLVIKLLGTGAVLAKSFARIFFRNCVNVGLAPLIVDTDGIRDGDQLEADLDTGLIRDLTTGEELRAPPLPPVMQRIIADGGLVAHVKKHGKLTID